MSKVLFTHSYLYRLDAKQWRFKQPYPPLATIQAAAVVRNAGFDVALFDTGLENTTQGLTRQLQHHRPQYVVIYDDGFNYLTKMCLTVMRDAAFQLSTIAKRFGCTVIIATSDATDHFEKYFQHHVDFVIAGEGELTLLQLLEGLERRSDIAEIPGLIFKRLGKTLRTVPRELIRDLDSLPLPAWDLVDLERYRKIWKKHHGYFSLNISTTRGCPFKCNWCAKPIYGNRYHARSPEHVVAEIEHLRAIASPDHVWFCDDIFGLKPNWVRDFAERLKAKGLSIRYKIQSRADLLDDTTVVDALRDSGAAAVWIGAESGSQKILDAMEKGTTVEQIENSTHMLRQRGINVGYFLQFGYPGETRTDIGKTLDMLRANQPDEIGISISYPLPGTAFYERVKSQMGEKQNWTDSNDLDMMFEGTYGRDFYRHLHRYVHATYRADKGFRILKKLLKNPTRLNKENARASLSTPYFAVVSFAQRWRMNNIERKSLKVANLS